MADFLETSVRVRVPFHDVDPVCIVWHGNYFKYFEAARVALLDKLDYSYAAMADSGYIWPLVDLSARFSKPITFDQVIVVTARLIEWEYRLKITYAIADPDGTALGKGMTVQVPLEAESREMVVGSPAFLIERVERAMEAKAV